MSASSTAPAQRRVKGRTRLVQGLAAAGAALLIVTLSPFAGTSTAGYTDTVFAQVDGVAVPPTTALAAVVPSGALDTTQVLDVAGNLWIWGYYGNRGPGTSSAGQGGGVHGIDYSTGVGFNYHKPNKFTALTNIKTMASSAYANYAVDEHGNLFGWGQNNGGLFMFGKNFSGTGIIVPPGTTPQNVTTNWANAIMDTDVVSVAAVEYGAAYTKADGTVWTVGDNAFAQRGQGNTSGAGGASSPLRYATQVTQWPGGSTPALKAVYGAYEGYFALGQDNTVYFWGRNYRGGAGVAPAASGCSGTGGVGRVCLTPIVVPAVTAFAQAEGVASIGGGYSHGYLLTKQGNLYSWGSEEFNFSGSESSSSAGFSLPFLKATDVTAAATRYRSTQYITSDGTAWAYGHYGDGGAYSLSPPPSRTPINSRGLTGKVWDPALDASGRKAELIGGIKDSGTLVLEDGTILSWGENGGGAACGGFSSSTCRDINGNNPTGGSLYVWPAAIIAGIQNVGNYQTVSLNSNPFTGSAVLPGETIKYTAVSRNTFTEPANYTVSLDLTGFADDVEVVPGSARVTVGDQASVDAAYTDGVVTWTGNVPRRSQVVVELEVRVKAGSPAGVTMQATASLSVSGSTNTDTDSVVHVTTTNPNEVPDCDSCAAP